MNSDSIAIGMDLAEIEEYYERKQVDDEIAKVRDMQSRAELDADVEDIVSEAKDLFDEALAGTTAESTRSRLSGISEHRQTEIEMMNQEYRREVLDEEGILNVSDPKLSTSGSGSDSDEEYVQRPRLGGVQSLLESD